MSSGLIVVCLKDSEQYVLRPHNMTHKRKSGAIVWSHSAGFAWGQVWKGKPQKMYSQIGVTTKKPKTLVWGYITKNT